jgi:hypothetical protein
MTVVDCAGLSRNLLSRSRTGGTSGIEINGFAFGPKLENQLLTSCSQHVPLFKIFKGVFVNQNSPAAAKPFDSGIEGLQ